MSNCISAKMLVAAGFGLLLAGCTDSSRPTEPAKSIQPVAGVEAPSTGDAKVDASPISAAVMSLPEINDAIAAHKGQVVVVDLWAMW